MMKRFLMILLALMLCAAPALAENAVTELPFGVHFRMDGDAVKEALAGAETFDTWYDDGTGTVALGRCDTGVDGLTAMNAALEITRNNSAQTARLSQMSMALDVGDNCIQAFRSALAALTKAYGEPDVDPFDEGGVATYVEYGTLSASWTKEDVRINLTMYRMYGDSLMLDFADRLCYDAADLGL